MDGEPGERFSFTRACGSDEFLSALALLFEVETECGRRPLAAVGHGTIPFRIVCVRHQTEKGYRDSQAVIASWAQPFPRTWKLRPSENIVQECTALRQRTGNGGPAQTGINMLSQLPPRRLRALQGCLCASGRARPGSRSWPVLRREAVPLATNNSGLCRVHALLEA